jgi:hypothetical protein
LLTVVGAAGLLTSINRGNPFTDLPAAHAAWLAARPSRNDPASSVKRTYDLPAIRTGSAFCAMTLPSSQVVWTIAQTRRAAELAGMRGA